MRIKLAMQLFLLQDIMEKSVVLGLASGTKQVSASLERLVCYYAELLASQGLLDTALEYLNLSPADNSSQEMQILRDRISQSSQGIYIYIYLTLMSSIDVLLLLVWCRV